MAALTLPAVPVEGGLSLYFREVWSFPILEKDEEQSLARQWRDEGDTDAAHKLVTSHLRLVAKMAMKYRGYGLPVADLVSEGNIGLMKAVKKFDPELGFRLSTYAMWWIKASITEYILKSWSMVKLGTVSSQKKLFFSLRSIKSRLNILDSGELSPEQADRLSDVMNVSSDEITKMNRRLSSRDLSLNAPMSMDDEGMEFQDTLVAHEPSPERQLADAEELSHHSAILRQAMQGLPDREREILAERRLSDNPLTLEDLGKRFGISRERVRQLEVRAFDKVQAAVQDAVAQEPVA
ncbi:MAG: RNA polymerase sigma factor RpoH [Rhodospirillales bacterium]|nr:RNA polymerase sigma factor RpoH [Alphaproteobacteria bacterium]MBL6948514.1 RNA polymerase sigma factor RpoH [Rhodospirillales bacterium]